MTLTPEQNWASWHRYHMAHGNNPPNDIIISWEDYWRKQNSTNDQLIEALEAWGEYHGTCWDCLVSGQWRD